MSKIHSSLPSRPEDYTGVMGQYSEEEVESFNRTIEAYLETPEIDDTKRAVSYFYLLAYKLEHEQVDCYAYLQYDDIRNLEGKVLTILEAVIDPLRFKAVRDTFRQILWFVWVESLGRKGDIPVGMPSLNKEYPDDPIK